MEQLMAGLPALLTVGGLLAVLVSAITEVTKNLGPLRRFPTDALVIILSVTLTLAALLGWADYSGAVLSWYLLAGGLVGGLLVAFVAMYGWATFFDLLERFGWQQEQEDKQNELPQ